MRSIADPVRSALSLCALVGSAALLATACNTGAVAVGECREIERARCEALEPCGTIDDVAACKRYARDSCLHGIAGPKPPTGNEQTECVSMIREAGLCAQQDRRMAPEACEGLAEIDLSPNPKQSAAKTVCDLAKKPWNYVTCDYVNEAEESMGGGDG